MPADFTFVQGDDGPVVTDTLTNSDGTVPTFTGATITPIVRSMTAPTIVQGLSNTTSFTNVTTGAIQWAPTAADTSLMPTGSVMLKWKVVYQTGQTQTFPTSGYLWGFVEPKLSDEPQALVGLPDVKDYLNAFGIDRIHDDKLLGYIYAATPVVENIVGPIIVRTVEEWHDGGQFWIQLRRRPSTSLGTTPILQILGCDEYRGPIKYPLSIVADPTQATIYSVMLNAQSGTLYRRSTGGGVIPFGAGWTGSLPQAVHVTYQAGQATVPPNVRTATLEAIREYYQNTMPTGTGARSIADTYDQGSTVGFSTYLDRFARGALAPNRRRPAIA